MKVGVLCEESGTVRDAFAARGHDAWSCDILPRPGKHLRGDCLSFDWSGFDMLICFPPCTHLASSGAGHMEKKRRDGRQRKAIDFVLSLAGLPVECIAIENPVGVLSAEWRKPDQIIQPYEFGHDASKATCLWLRGLPPLEPTEWVPPFSMCVEKHRWRGSLRCPVCDGYAVTSRPRWANQTDSGQNIEPPGHMRARRRSVTYPGIAAAMADQWGSLAAAKGGRGE